jgi:hypothetical protein
MNPEARAKLDEIVKKDLASLTVGDIEFLQARRSYLTPEQTIAYSSVLAKPISPEAPIADPKQIPYKELQRKAKAMNLPYVGVSREDLERSIDTVEGPAGATKPA